MGEFPPLLKQSRENVPAKRLALSRRPVPTGLLKYYVKERPQIARWNTRVGLLSFGMLGLRLTLAADFQKRFNDVLTHDVFPLFAMAQQMVDEGWRWPILSIREYNVIVFFVDLCEKLVALSDAGSFSDSDFYKMFESLLRITARPDYQRLLLGAFEKVLIEHRRSDPAIAKKTKRRLDSLNRFFSPDTPSKSIYSLVRAYCMVASRRYLEWSDLTRPSNSDWLRDDFYDCSPETLKSIVAYVRELSSEIERYTKELDWLTALRDASGVDDGRAPASLIAYHERYGAMWQKDSEDFFGLLFSIVKRVNEDLERVLHGEFDVMTPNEKIVKARVVDDEELEQLYRESTELVGEAEGRYLALGHARIAISVFRSTDRPKELLPTEGHRTTLEIVDRMLSSLYRIGVALRHKWEENSYRESFYLTHMIVNPQDMRGRPVIDLFAVHSGLLLQICGYFKNKDLISQVRRIPTLEKNLGTRRAEKERLDANGKIESMVNESAPKPKKRY